MGRHFSRHARIRARVCGAALVASGAGLGGWGAIVTVAPGPAAAVSFAAVAPCGSTTTRPPTTLPPTTATTEQIDGPLAVQPCPPPIFILPTTTTTAAPTTTTNAPTTTTTGAVVVVQPESAPPTTSAPVVAAATLAATGAKVALMVWVGFALLAAGTLMLVATRHWGHPTR